MKLFGTHTFVAALALAGALFCGQVADAQQAAQWNYGFVGGTATATYPGNVVVAGSINTSNAPIVCASITVVCFQVLPTWNNGATTYTGVFVNATDTSSAAGSLLLDLQTNTVDQFNVSKAGQVVANGRILANGFLLTGGNQYQFNGGGGFSIDGTSNIIKLSNSTNSQTYRVYNTFTDASNYERAFMDWTTTANLLRIGMEAAGTGSQRQVNLYGGSIHMIIGGSTDTWQFNSAGPLFASTDNLYDIGASGANRPRNVFIGTSLVAGGNLTAGATGVISMNGRGVIGSDADGNLTLENQSGTSFSLLKFGGTTASFPAWKRNGILLEARLADDSGTTGVTTNFVVGTSYVQTTAITFASLAGCVAGLTGARSFITDSNTAVFAASAAGGGANKVPVYCDGAAWHVGDAANDNLPPGLRESADRLWAAFG